MNRRRIELQLRILQAVLRSELRRGSPETLALLVERSDPILQRVALEIEGEADPELLELFATVRAEVDSARSS